MAVCDKNIGYTLSNVTNGKVVLRQSYSQIQSIFCGQPGFVLRIRGFAKSLANASLPSKVDSALTCLCIHQRGGESGLDYLKAKGFEQRHVLLRGEGRGEGRGQLT